MTKCYACHKKTVQLYSCVAKGCENYGCYKHTRVWDRSDKRIILCLYHHKQLLVQCGNYQGNKYATSRK